MPKINEVHDQYVVDVSLNNQVEAGAQAVIRSFDAIQKSSQAAAADVSASGEKVAAAYPQWDRLARKYDDVTAAANKLKNAEEALARAQEVSTIALQRGGDQEQVNRVLAEMSDRVAIARQSLLDLRAATDAAAEADERWGGSMGQLRASVDDVFATSQRYAKQLADLSTASATLGLSQEQQDVLLDRLNARYAASAAPLSNMKDAMAQAAAEMAKANAETQAYQERLDALTSKYSSTSAAAKQWATAQEEIALLEREGRLSAEQAAAALDQQAAAYDRVTAAAKASAAAFEQSQLASLRLPQAPTAQQSASRQADVTAVFGQGLTEAEHQYNAVAAAQAHMSEETIKLNVLLANGLVTQNQYTEAMAKLQAGVDAAAKGIPVLNVSLEQNRFATRQAGVQMIQFFTSIEAGQPVFIAFIQQAHQMLDVALVTGTGFGVLKNAITSALSAIGAFITGNPLIAAGAVIAATLTAIGVAAESSQSKLLGMQAALRGTHEDYVALANDAMAAAKAVSAQTGLGSGDARAAATAIAGAFNFRGTQQDLQALIITAADLATVMGQKIPDAAKIMRLALDDPAKAAKDLAEARLPGMSFALADTIRHMQNMGDAAGAAKLAIETIQAAVDGARAQSLTPLGTLLESLAEAFNAVGQAAAEAGNAVASAVANATRGQATLQDLEAGRGISVQGEQQQQQLPVPPIPPQFGADYQSINTAVETGLKAISSTPQEDIKNRTDQILQFEDALMKLADAGTTSGKEVDILTQAIRENSHAIDEDVKKINSQVDALTKQTAQIEVSIAAENRLAAAYAQGSAAVRDAIALQTAEKQALSEGLIPGTREYADAVARLTPEIVKQNQAKAGADIAKETQDLKDKTEVMRAEVKLTGEGNTAREIRIARAKAEQELDKQGIAVASAEGQAYLAAAEALGRATGAKEDSTKKTQSHVSALQKQQETLQVSIKNEQDLIDAYTKDAAAVAHVIAQQEVEKKLITDGLIPGSQKYNAALKERLPLQERLNQLNAEGALSKQNVELRDQIQYVEAETASIGMNAESRAVMLAHLKAEQELRRQNIPLTDQAAQTYLNETDALTRATQAQQQHLAALSYLSNAFTQAFDTIGNAMTQAFISGQGAAVNWGNVMKSVVQQVIQAFVKLAILNPLLNSLFGQSNVTLDSVLGAIGGVGGLSSGGATSSATGGTAGGFGGGSLLSTGSNLLSGVGILDQLGLTNIGGQLSTFGQTIGLTGQGGLLSNLGLTGQGGLFSNIGSGISGFLSQGLFGTSVIEAGAPSFAAAAFNPALIGQLPAAAGTSGTFGATGLLGGTSIGQLAGGIGAGFGLGSLAGGFLQSSIGKTGYGPTIGAGVGSVAGAAIGSIVPGVGTLIGGLIGGLLGGGGGGLIGPNVKNPYSLTNIGINAQGQLTVGSSAFQKLDSNAAQTAADVKTVNDALTQLGVRISAVTVPWGGPGPVGIGPGGVPFFGAVGSPNPKGGDDFFAPNVGAAFSGFRFGSADPRINQFLQGKSYADPNALAQAVQTYQQQVKLLSDFLAQTAAMLATKTTGSFQDAQDAISQTFNAQIDAAEKWKNSGIANEDEMNKLTQAENDLTAARDKALAANAKAIEDLANQQVQSLYGRYLTAQATVSGRPGDAQSAQLFNFDLQAQDERQKLKDQWKGIFGDAYQETWEYKNSSEQLERALGTERLAIQKQYNDLIAAQAAQIVAQQQSLTGRYLTAHAQRTGDPGDIASAAFYNIDIRAQQERLQLAAQYKQMFGEGYEANADYVRSSVLLEQALGEERLLAQKQADDAIANQARAAERQRQTLYGRYLTALATVTGSDADAMTATLYNFDIQAQSQRDQLADQYKALYGDAYRTNYQFVTNSIQLEQTLGEERLAIQKQADNQIIQQQKAATSAAQQTITSLVQYAHSLQFGTQSPLSPQAQLELAQRQFNAVAGAARAGDAGSINQIQTYAQSLLQAAQTFWGSGQSYVDIFNQVVDTLDAIAAESPDTLTASYFALQTQTQTQTLVDELQALRDEVVALRLQVASSSGTPSRIAA